MQAKERGKAGSITAVEVNITKLCNTDAVKGVGEWVQACVHTAGPGSPLKTNQPGVKLIHDNQHAPAQHRGPDQSQPNRCCAPRSQQPDAPYIQLQSPCTHQHSTNAVGGEEVAVLAVSGAGRAYKALLALPIRPQEI
jgi:hypothetical protein